MDGAARSLLDWLGGRGGATAWDALIATGVAHSVAPQLLAALKAGATRGVDVPAAAIQCAWLAAIAQRRDAARGAAEVAPVLRVLGAAGITPVLLKGAHLARAAYAEPGDRPMRDLDLLVGRDEVAAAEGALIAFGYRATRTQPIETYFDRLHELPEVVADGRLPIELHWALVPPDRDAAIDVGLIARSVGITIDGVAGRVLAWEDALLHICLHAAGEDQFGLKGLRPLLDIAAIIERGTLDWAVVAARARDWRAVASVRLGLALTARLLDVVMPDGARAISEPPVPPRLLAIAAAQVMERPGMRVEAPVTPPGIVHLLRHPARAWRFFAGSRPSLAVPGPSRRRARAATGWLIRLVARSRAGTPGLVGGLARRVARGVVIDRWLSARRQP